MRLLATSAAVLVLAVWLAARAGSPLIGQVTFLYTATKQYEPTTWLHGEERFPQGANIFMHDRSGEHRLLPDFAASADPVVSFDGQRVLFSGKRTVQDPWEIWEFSLADKNARREVACAQDCIRPLYLPDGRVVYASKLDGHFVIEVSTPGKADRQPLTYSPASSLPLDVIRDGRVLFEAGYPFGEHAAAELYTVYTDGSGVEAYRCDHGPSRHSGRQLASGDIVFVSEHRLARFTSPLAHEAKITAPAGEYDGNIAEFSDGRWLLPWRPNSRRLYELMLGKTDSSKLDLVLRRSDAHLIQPVLLESRPVPNRHPSGLHDWSYAHLLCLNVYTSKYRIAANSVDRLRLYSRDVSGHPRLLGEAHVEKDGSFYVRTPGDQPLQIELIDSNAKTVKRENGWFWLRRGEQRICVGCHAGPEMSPENAVPLVLQRSTVPADLTGNTPAVASGGH